MTISSIPCHMLLDRFILFLKCKQSINCSAGSIFVEMFSDARIRGDGLIKTKSAHKAHLIERPRRKFLLGGHTKSRRGNLEAWLIQRERKKVRFLQGAVFIRNSRTATGREWQLVQWTTPKWSIMSMIEHAVRPLVHLAIETLRNGLQYLAKSKDFQQCIFLFTESCC
jgi:hypothetical protein